jgi:DUF438 domain-containing protein
MGELTDDLKKRKDLLKHMILQIHKGEAPAMVKARLAELLGSIPYDEVVAVEQELIAEGLPMEEVLRFCDIHQMVLEGKIDPGKETKIPEGHPLDTLRKENRELEKVIKTLDELFSEIKTHGKIDIKEWMLRVRAGLNSLMDVDKHYRKKEYLLFPFLEKYEITGPPKVMWGKHDEIRELLKASIEAVSGSEPLTAEEAESITDLVLIPAVKGVNDMIAKEEEILFPMCLEKLTEEEWYSVYRQTGEFGYCLYDPQSEWRPEGGVEGEIIYNKGSNIHLSTGSFI